MGEVKQIFDDSYEVVVVGAGVGGLTAAAILAKSGFDVLVLEKNHVPGGCCTSFRRGDYTFDALATDFTGFGDSGFNAPRALLDYLEQELEIVNRKSSHRVLREETAIEVHRDLDRYLVELGSAFPQQMGGIYSFFRQLERLYRASLAAMSDYIPLENASPGQRLLMPIRAHYHISRFLPGSRRTMDKYFRRYLKDEGLRRYLDAELLSLMGTTLEQTPALQGAACLIDRHIEGTCYPLGSSLSLPNILEKSVIELGGNVACRTGVERLLVDQDRVTGVLLRDGRKIGADIVISNLSLFSLAAGLLDPGLLSSRNKEWLGEVTPPPSCLCVYLGVDGKILPEDLLPKSLLLPDDAEESQYVVVHIPSLQDHTLAPPGHHCISIFTPVEPGLYPRPGDPEVDSDEYDRKKSSGAGDLIKRAERLIPGLSGAITHMEVATPTTIESHTGRVFGSLRNSPGVGGDYRGVGGCTTEISGLLTINDLQFFSSGICTAIFSGIGCANRVLRRHGSGAIELGPSERSFVVEMPPGTLPELAKADIVDNLSAAQEAQRCMRCRDAPCIDGCPAGVDVLTFIRRLLNRNLEGAAKTIRQQNPLGEVCGVLCPTENLCERRCNRRLVDRPIRIGELQAYACRSVVDTPSWPSRPVTETSGRVAVIGSGPAGISAAFYLSLQKYAVEMIEERSWAGGLPATAIPEVWLDRSTPDRNIRGALSRGIEYRGNTVFGTDVTLESLKKEGCAAVFLGLGLNSSRRLGIPGEELPETMGALGFLRSSKELSGRNMPARITVIGRDNLALASAVVAKQLGAKKVLLVSPSSEKGTGDRPEYLETARDRGVELVFNRNPLKIKGETRVEAVDLSSSASVTDDPQPGSSVSETIDTDMVIVSAGRELGAGLKKYLDGRIALTEDGRVKVNPETMMTSMPGVFAGGEIVSGPGLVVEAVAQGRRAAVSMDRYLRGEELMPPV